MVISGGNTKEVRVIGASGRGAVILNREIKEGFIEVTCISRPEGGGEAHQSALLGRAAGRWVESAHR